MKPRVFIDMDGTLVAWNASATVEDLYEKSYFRRQPPNWPVLGAVEHLLEIKADNYDVFICSCYFADSEYALQAKREWLKDFLPDLPDESAIFVPCGEPKTDYIPGGIHSTDILLDDYSRNLHQWAEAGGIAIKLLNGINGNNGTWLGERTFISQEEIVAHIVSHIDSFATPAGKDWNVIRSKQIYSTKAGDARLYSCMDCGHSWLEFCDANESPECCPGCGRKRFAQDKKGGKP